MFGIRREVDTQFSTLGRKGFLSTTIVISTLSVGSLSMRCRGTTWWNNVLSWLVVGMVISTRTWQFVRAQDMEPQNFKYVHTWASQDGETHIAQCKMQNFTYQVYGLLPQYVKSDFGGVPTEIVFSELPVNFTQGLHSPPAVQFVITLAGDWYVATTDGSEYTFSPGEALFQDNTKNSPADKVPQHYSGVNGTVPCQQFLVQLNRTAQVDSPCPF